ncbi:DNA mismatch repair endonuclease MutL [Psychrobacter sp. AOP7-B1-24]|uniref:DNA mismatch repair endonuclease MutL n=1 Tax=Psychrobacter sp. AOP7-B1-24 TaxID=3457645 RepID=UPI00402BC871
MSDNYSNTRIKKLSPLLINQLAAGEVVTRPAAVVKELLENAIDAGATNIEIHITQGGMGMIEVVDNGVGIHPDDMVMAITRHATSKVADVANLHGIATLGFRGEALAATAAVSRLTLSSSHDDSGVGRQLQVSGVLADEPKLIPIVHNRGTTITVKDLYFNVPARRGNLKSIATEFGHIESMVRDVALARADVALTLFHDNKKRMSLSSHEASSTLQATSAISNHHDNVVGYLPLSRLEQATGMALIDNAIQIMIDLASLLPPTMVEGGDSGSSHDASIRGWIWPMLRQESQDALPKLLYVNGRLVKEPILSNQLRQLSHSAGLNSIGYALYFDLPTQWLNINVHPSKQRIKIGSLNNIMAHLNHAIQSKLKHIDVPEQPATHDKPLIKDSTFITDAGIGVVPTTQSYESALSPNRNRQVNTAKQPYEHPGRQAMSQPQYLVESALNGSESTGQYANISNNILAATADLPTCLEVISDLDTLAPDTDTDTDTDISFAKCVEDTSLPWLLFFHQGQCFLIGEQDWQSKLSQLFEAKILSGNILQEAKQANTAKDVNQQLVTISQQMSAQDLMLFMTDIETLLNKHSIKAISTHHLAALMLL